MFSASSSAIEELPDSFGRLINLSDLKLSNCQNLASLPNSIWKLKLLKLLDLSSSSKLEQLEKMQCLGYQFSYALLLSRFFAVVAIRIERLRSFLFSLCM